MTIEPAVSAVAATERTQLDVLSWVDVTRGFLANSGELYAALRDASTWSVGRVFRYERWVEEPRLSAMWRPDPAHPAHRVMAEMHRTLQHQ